MPINNQPSTINFLRGRWFLAQTKEIVEFDEELTTEKN